MEHSSIKFSTLASDDPRFLPSSGFVKETLKDCEDQARKALLEEVCIIAKNGGQCNIEIILLVHVTILT